MIATRWIKQQLARLRCSVFGHKLRFVRDALEGGKIFRCKRCGQVLWRTSEGWYRLGDGQGED